MNDCRSVSGFAIRIVFALILALASISGEVFGDDTFAIRAGRIIPVSPDLPDEINDGIVIIRDGKIAEIGRDVTIPMGMQVIDLPDATIMPGMVAAMTGVAGNHRGDESIAAGYRAVDAFDRYSSNARLLEGGITTVHLNPGTHRLLTGRGAVVRLAGAANERVMRADADITINLGDSAYSPPRITELLVPPASDQEITPDRTQRPTSRMSQMLALTETVEAATRSHERFDFHQAVFAQAWEAQLPLRVHVDRAHDVLAALSFMNAYSRKGYLVGGAEAAKVAERIADAGVPLVYSIPAPFRRPGNDIGINPDAVEPDIRDLANLKRLDLALAVESGDSPADLRLAASLALRAGLHEQRIIEAITIVPARLLGVDDRVGSLTPGKDADILVLSDRPLATSSHVQRVYVQGRLVYRSQPSSSAIVVRAGTIWLGPNNHLQNGAVLIENGKIVEVGNHVSHPPHARLIDAGPGGFIAPGLIDARGQLGLYGDRSSLSPQLTLARLIGLPDEPERRVARAGVTTVMMSPYTVSGSGSQISAIRTAGKAREERVVRATAAVAFDLSGVDPAAIAGRLHPRLEAGRSYLQLWKKYEEELAAWKKAQAEGTEVEAAPEVVEVEVEEVADDR